MASIALKHFDIDPTNIRCNLCLLSISAGVVTRRAAGTETRRHLILSSLTGKNILYLSLAPQNGKTPAPTGTWIFY